MSDRRLTLDGAGERLAAEFSAALRHSQNEFELRLHIEPTIRTLLTQLYEISLDQIRSERPAGPGRLDTAYGGMVVEFEWNMGGRQAHKRHAAQQALDYLAAERQRLGLALMFTACVTDGHEWGFLIADPAFDEQFNLFAAPPADPVERFVWQPNSPAACRRFLELVGSNPQTAITGEALSIAFGADSAEARRAVTVLLEAIVGREQDDRTDTLYREWRRSLEIAYGILDRPTNDDYGVREAFRLTVAAGLGETLFALHTYFALVARLVALEVLAISVGDQAARPSTWAAADDAGLRGKLVSFEEGRLPTGLHVSNLLEGDVFGWYLNQLGHNVSILAAIRSICGVLDGFAFPRLAFGASLALDIFRDLYLRLTTRELRGALGEFLTPGWLAEATLEFASTFGVNLQAARLLDPTCGTGTFLSPVIAARLRSLRTAAAERPLAAAVQDVLNDVVGIDINPVAVVATRMNYLIALGDLAGVGDLRLPVYLADSILLPEASPVQENLARHDPDLLGSHFVEIATSLPTPFVVPVECLEQEAFTRLLVTLKASLDAANTEAEFAESLRRSFAPGTPEPVVREEDWPNLLTVARVLFKQIVALLPNRDGVWAEIIENRFAPLFLRPFDVVVGNPPWLTFTKLPAAWRRAAEPLWRSYGLYDSPRMPGVIEPASLHTSDLAVLVVAVALDRYLRRNGILAFVTPKSLVNGDPGNRAFRTCALDSARDELAPRQVHVPFRLLDIEDFSEVQPFRPDAANNPVVLVIRSHEAGETPVSGGRWFRRTANSRIPAGMRWEDAKRAVLRRDTVAWNPISNYSASPLAWWLPEEQPLRGEPSPYTYGKGFDTRGANGILLVTIRGDAQDGLVRVSNTPALGHNAELQAAGPHVASVEAALVVPAIRGRDVKAFSATPSWYLLLAHDPAERARPLNDATLRLYPGARGFLSHFRDSLTARSPYMNFRPARGDWWQVQGLEHMDRGFFVCVPEFATGPRGLAAAVVGPIWDERLGQTILPVPDHKIDFFNTLDPEEAFYLAGMLNSEPVALLFERFANLIAISPATLRYLPIPKFASALPLHREIAELSRRAHGEEEPERVGTVRELNTLAYRVLGAG